MTKFYCKCGIIIEVPNNGYFPDTPLCPEVTPFNFWKHKIQLNNNFEKPKPIQYTYSRWK